MYCDNYYVSVRHIGPGRIMPNLEVANTTLPPSHLGSALSPAGRLGVAGLTELLQLVQSGPQEVHLLVTVDVLLPQVLVLLLQLLQLVGHPVLDPSCLGLHLLGVSQSLLALEMGVLSRQQSVSVTSNMHHCIRPVLASSIRLLS